MVDVSVHKVVVSVTVTVYTPAVNPEIDWVVAPPGLQEYVNGPTPPLTPTVAVPSFPPLQETGVELAVALKLQGIEFTVVVAVAIQPFASVTVTAYVPAPRPVIVCVVCPPGLH